MTAIDRFLRRLGIKNIPAASTYDRDYMALRDQYVKKYNHVLDELEARGLYDLAEQVGELVTALSEMDEYERKYAYLSGLICGVGMTLRIQKNSPATRVG